MRDDSRTGRQKKIDFAVGIAAIDGGRPSPFTKELLTRYENGLLSSTELKKAIEENYSKDVM